MINFGKKNKVDKEEKIKQSSTDGREMYQAVCSNCGDKCELPFKPSGDKPVFCSDCYQKKRNADSRQSGVKSRKMYQAVCSNCGNDCELPFKPSSDKPVFCRDCYGKGGHGGNRGSQQSPGQFEVLNAKLDKILEILIPHAAVKTTPKKKIVTKVKVDKPKKVAKKSVKKAATKKKVTTAKKKK